MEIYMKNACRKLVEIVKTGEYTTREAVLSGLCLFLVGMLIGIFASPRKHVMVGSNNGNNNNGTFDGYADLSDDDEEE